MFSNIVDPEKPGHVTWFGADVNSICVARAELILHLIRTEACSPKEILQIWYSSSISQEAMKALKRCCQILAKDETMKMKGLNQYFEFWGNVRVELSSEKARLQWLMESSPATREPITDMMKVIDRQSISRYFLTGEIFLGGGKNNQGNITTFLSPENALENRIEANIFSTINLRDIPEVEGSFVTAVETLFLTKLTSFQSHLKSYKIQINLSDGIIARDAATNDAMLTNIRTVTKPDVMYWSNLPEYWTRKEFFEIAKLCSTSETKHCFHLMNWHQSVYGCNPIDYMVFDKQRAASIPFKDFNGNTSQMAQLWKKEFYNKELNNISPVLARLNISKPLRYNFFNMNERVLCGRHFKQYIDYFFKGQVCSDKVTESAAYSPFLSINNLLNVSFKF